MVTGVIFAVLMIALYYFFIREANGGPIFVRGINPNINPHEMGIFFSVFVFLQFWNMLNARAFATGKSVFNNMKGSRVFWAVVMVIFIGQILIVQCCYQLFDCAPLSFTDWLMVIFGTSPVLFLSVFVKKVKNRSVKSQQ